MSWSWSGSVSGANGKADAASLTQLALLHRSLQNTVCSVLSQYFLQGEFHLSCIDFVLLTEEKARDTANFLKKLIFFQGGLK